MTFARNLETSTMLIMKKTLSDQFQENGGAPVMVGGREVVPAKSINLRKGLFEISVSLSERSGLTEQGVVILSKGGVIMANGVEASKIVLWQDSCPPVALVKLCMSRDGEVLFWNVWREGSITQAWVRDAGLMSSEAEGGFTLSCSGPSPGLSFDDLTVAVEFGRL